MTEAGDALAPIVERAISQTGKKLRFQSVQRLSGGAINQNFLIELATPDNKTERWVLRRGQTQAVPGTLNRSAEYALVAHARSLGMTVPEPIALLNPTENSVSIFSHCEGKTDPRMLSAWVSGKDARPGNTTSDNPSSNNPQTRSAKLTQALGRELALLHSDASSDQAEKNLQSHLGARPTDGLLACAQLIEKSFKKINSPQSYLTAAYDAWIDESKTIAKTRTEQAKALNITEPKACLCHHDFRLGNLMINTDTENLSAVLDWEFANWGDPLADIGWLSAPCWRFGGKEAIAGFGKLEDFIAGYAKGDDDGKKLGEKSPAKEAPLKLIKTRLETELPFWQRYAHLRWAVIAAQQGERAITGEAEALELRITGAMVASIIAPVLEQYWQTTVAPMVLETALPPSDAALDHLLAESALHLKNHLAVQLAGSAKYSALMSANAIRLARASLRVPSSKAQAPDPKTHPNPQALPPKAANPPKTGPEGPKSAREDLARDLAIWGFKG